MSKKTTLLTCLKIIALFCLQLNGEEETRQQTRLRMASCTLAVSRSRSAIPEAKNMFEVSCSRTNSGRQPSQRPLPGPKSLHQSPVSERVYKS